MNPPPQHVLDGWQSAEFWANKVLREHRATAPAQVRPCSSPKHTLFLGVELWREGSGPAALRLGRACLCTLSAAVRPAPWGAAMQLVSRHLARSGATAALSWVHGLPVQAAWVEAMHASSGCAADRRVCS